MIYEILCDIDNYRIFINVCKAVLMVTNALPKLEVADMAIPQLATVASAFGAMPCGYCTLRERVFFDVRTDFFRT